MPAPEVHLACARPTQFAPGDWDELAAMLHDDEREASRRFRNDADRRAYIAAHAILRALVAHETALAPDEIDLCHDAKGRPFVAQAPDVHVSVSRSRDAVVCVATRMAPVGVDIEKIDGKPVDAGLLGAFVAAPEPVTARSFFFQWTALEAFWKACGTGLVDENPRIACVPRGPMRFDVRIERSTGASAGRGAIVQAYDDCALAVVLRAPADPDFILKRTQCASAVDIKQLGRAHAEHERFFAA
jgi:4'-phosphopantetheinyl transferase